MTDIGLGEAIKALRAELAEARTEGDGSWLRFEVGPVNLELQLVVTKDGHGQIGWKILEVGGALGSERTQKVSMTLTPQWWDGDKKQYTTDFLVAGVVAAPAPGAAEEAPSSLPLPLPLPLTEDDPEDEE